MLTAPKGGRPKGRLEWGAVNENEPRAGSRHTQAERAAKYWNAAYTETAHKEWIVAPSEVIQFLPPSDGRATLDILEVGCGDSRLGMGVYDFYDEAMGPNAATVTCTDVSLVAIDRLVALQAADGSRKRPRLAYRYADATDLRATFATELFDVVLVRAQASRRLRWSPRASTPPPPPRLGRGRGGIPPPTTRRHAPGQRLCGHVPIPRAH